jgi:ABC-2 type transport system ATP-binding protein
VEEIEHILTDVMFIRDGRIVLESAMEDLGERYTEVLVNADSSDAARVLKPIDERNLPFGKTVMLFDANTPSGTPSGVTRAQLAALGETRVPGLADLFVAVMKGTYA